jgi:hypothetical protein
LKAKCQKCLRFFPKIRLVPLRSSKGNMAFLFLCQQCFVKEGLI